MYVLWKNKDGISIYGAIFVMCLNAFKFDVYGNTVTFRAKKGI